MSINRSGWTEDDTRRWALLLMLETILTVICLFIIVVIIVVGVWYERTHVFTNVGLIVVFGGLNAEFVRRMRHFREDQKLRAKR